MKIHQNSHYRWWVTSLRKVTEFTEKINRTELLISQKVSYFIKLTKKLLRITRKVFKIGEFARFLASSRKVTIVKEVANVTKRMNQIKLLNSQKVDNLTKLTRKLLNINEKSLDSILVHIKNNKPN